MKITILSPEIPEYIRPDASQSKAASNFIQYAYDNGIKPSTKAGGITKPMQVVIDQNTFNSLTQNNSQDPAITLGQYIAAVIDFHVINTQAPVDNNRDKYQQQFYDGIAGPLQKGRIVLAEGATGIGKGRVLAKLGKESADSGKGPVIIAAPSVSVLKQLIDEWIKTAYPINNVSCVLGKQQFIDSDALTQLLVSTESPIDTITTHEQINKIIEWIGGGCIPIKGNTNTESLVKISPQISCLEADLLYLAPELESLNAHFALNEYSSQESLGYIAYKLLREEASDSKIIFATHAMVAYDLMVQKINKSRILPEYRTILVDEAHLFERNIANIHTHNLSIAGLKTALKQSKAGSSIAREKCIDLCYKIMNGSMDMPTSDTGNRIYYASDFNGQHQISIPEKDVFNNIVQLKNALALMLNKTRKKDNKLSIMLAALYKITSCVTNPSSVYPVLFNNTPIRKWPVLTTGKKSVAKELNKIWEQVHGAVLVSATLTVPSGKSDENTREYIYNLLNIPPERGFVTTPVVPEWVIKTPTLMLPSQKLSPTLCYPNSREHKDNPAELNRLKNEWQVNVASVIKKAAKTAKGGMLVLLCSYEDVTKLGELLSESSSKRLIIKTPQASIEQQKKQFKDMARNGIKPIWLAVGNAWTGLDLRDELVSDNNPEQDLILTDLCIPRINFKDNQTISHLLRSRRKQTASFTEAAFTLRQGFGRLIRRPGLTDRRIWFLDGRILKTNYTVFRKILSQFPLHKEIK